jgi:hypothetical protein
MSTQSADTTDSVDRPTFRGCVFCYSAEWAYYGAKKAAGRLSGTDGD